MIFLSLLKIINSNLKSYSPYFGRNRIDYHLTFLSSSMEQAQLGREHRKGMEGVATNQNQLL